MKELFLYRIKQAEKPSKKEKYIRKVMMWIVVDIVFLALAVSLYNEALHTSYTVEITRWDARKSVEFVEGVNTQASTQTSIDTLAQKGNEEGAASPDPLQIIKKVFGEKAEAAEKIARCESGLNPERIGDEHLTSKDGDEVIGRSIGIFQIRTGGRDGGKTWNRAKANGMTVAEFEKKMMNPEENIKYAKQVFDRSGGWTPWTNCMKKEL